jgi:hypothetical protein
LHWISTETYGRSMWTIISHSSRCVILAINLWRNLQNHCIWTLIFWLQWVGGSLKKGALCWGGYGGWVVDNIARIFTQCLKKSRIYNVSCNYISMPPLKETDTWTPQLKCSHPWYIVILLRKCFVFDFEQDSGISAITIRHVLQDLARWFFCYRDFWENI